MPRAILLKTRNTPEDPYDIAFRSKTPFTPVFIPVLQHTKVNAPELRNILQNDPQNHYTALIMTSHRAVEALDDAMSSLTGKTPSFRSTMLTTA
jgi:uroporphyrinogen-III synthase